MRGTETQCSCLLSHQSAFGNRGVCLNPCPEPGHSAGAHCRYNTATSQAQDIQCKTQHFRFMQQVSEKQPWRTEVPEADGGWCAGWHSPPCHVSSGTGNTSPLLSLPAREPRVLGTQQEGAIAVPIPCAPQRSGSTSVQDSYQPLIPFQTYPEHVYHQQTILCSSTTINRRPLPTAHVFVCVSVLQSCYYKALLCLPPSLPPKQRFILQCSL